MKYIIDLPEGKPIIFLAEKRLAFVTPERDEMIVFDNSSGSAIKLTPYEDPNEIRIGDEIRRDDGEVIVVTGISKTGLCEGFNKCGTALMAYKAVKTGRHFDDVEILMDKMGKSE